MKSYSFYFVDVFTDMPFGGNPLAVFPEAQGMSTAQMQTLAKEINFSETTFVLPPANPAHTARVRIFTPGREIPFAGHPTLGTAWVLNQHRKLKTEPLILEEGVGPVSVFPAQRGWAFKTAQAPVYSPLPIGFSELADLLGLEVEQIGDGDWQPLLVTCGLTYTLIPLRDLSAIQTARFSWPLDHPLLLAHPPLGEVYLICRETEDPKRDFHARMFAPQVGVPEDPATGSAAATLAAYLQYHQPDISGSWHLEQGLEIQRPSHIQIRISEGQIYVQGEVQLQCQGQWFL